MTNTIANLDALFQSYNSLILSARSFLFHLLNEERFNPIIV